MANHPYNQHREQQVAHRRVGTILKGSPAGAEKHAQGHAFSKITSKSAAARDNEIGGSASKADRFAKGGRVKGGTTVNIVIPGQGAAPKPPMPMPMPPPMPMAGPPPMPGPGPGMPPPGGMPGMPPGPPPMRASGGRIKKNDGGQVAPTPEQTKKGNEYMNALGQAPRKASGGKVAKFTGGAITGVGREEKAAKAKRK